MDSNRVYSSGDFIIMWLNDVFAAFKENDPFGYWMWFTAIGSFFGLCLFFWITNILYSNLLNLLSGIFLIVCFWSWGYSILAGVFLSFVRNVRVKNIVGSMAITILLIMFAVAMGF